VDLRAGLDDLEKRKFLTLPGLELRSLGRPARRSYIVSRLFLWKTLYAGGLLYAFLRVSLSNCNGMGLQHGYISSTRPADVLKLRMQWPHVKAVIVDCVFCNRTHTAVLLERGSMFLQRRILFSGM
jgi:hypothetical protein